MMSAVWRIRHDHLVHRSAVDKCCVPFDDQH